MTDSINPEQSATEHLRNGEETGFLSVEILEKSVDFLLRDIDGWTGRDELKVLILRAFLQCCRDKPNQAAVGFTAEELVEQLAVIRKRPWPAAKDDAQEQVRRKWNEMEKLWETKLEGVMQGFADAGFDHYVLPERKKGGGSGHRTLYRLIRQPLAGHEDTDQDGQVLVGGCRYRSADVDDASKLLQTLFSGLGSHRWIRGLFILLPILAIIFLLLFGLGWYFQLSLNPQSGVEAWIRLFVTTGIGLASVWVSAGSLFCLPEWRIVSAPTWMQSGDDDRLLEWRIPPRHEHKAVKVVRYTAVCPICQGRVRVKAQSMLRPWDLIGRCEEAPAAHVFSFDHILRLGDRVQQQPKSQC